MQILKPIIHETIWGGNRLTQFTDSNCVKIGHLYSAIDTKDFNSSFIYGEYKGKTLHQWFIENRDKYGLGNYNELPILMALVEADDDLSIQVHPDDVDAMKLEGKTFGKNESFYIIQDPTKGWMYNGCKAKNVEEMKEKILENKIEDVLDTIPCEVGDYVYVVGGTLHAATAGSLSFEIEENCEHTYRFFDFNRVDKNGKKRELQIDKALACLDVNKKSKSRVYNNDDPIEERMYITRHIIGKDFFENISDMFSFAVMIKGEKFYDNVRVLPGTAILLEPSEILDVSNSEWIIVTPKVKE